VGEHELAARARPAPAREAARADQVDAATIALATRSGLREYFDPATGEGYGSQDFGWTAALVIDLLDDATPVQPPGR
jgi:hypothetical protein